MSIPQKSLLESGDERFRILVESVQDYGIFMLDPRGHVLTWNAGAEKLKGYSASDIIGKHFSIFYPREDVADGKCERELQAAEADTVYAEEGWRIRKDGTRFWASVTITALMHEGVLVGFAKVTRDLTDRKNAEEQALRFRLLVDSVKDYGIFILDPSGHIATWNIGAERLKGYRAPEILGRHFSIFYPPGDVAAGKCEQELQVAAREGRFEEQGWRVRKDGSVFWANVTITALHRDGALIGFAKVTRDLTEQRAIAEKIRKLAVEEAAIAERKKTQDFQERFLAILGHDLRNPLAALDMGTALLQQKSPDDSTNRVLARMRSSSRRMSRMIEQILDFTRSRLDGGLHVTRNTLELQSLLLRIIEELKTAHPHREIDLQCEPIIGSWDEDRLEQVFSNIIGNAIQYGLADRPIRIAVRRSDGGVSIAIQNDGPVIGEAQRTILFSPFRRGEKDSRTKETAGLGLGLFISKEIVMAHGGDIVVHSGLDQGTIFLVTLPIEDSNSIERPVR